MIFSVIMLLWAFQWFFQLLFFLELEGMKMELSKIPIKNVQPNIAKSELQAINKLTGKKSSWFLGNHVHAHVHAQNTIDFP